MMDRRAFIVGACGAFAAPLTAVAQPTGRVNRIGFLRVGPPPTAWIEGFRQGLRELQYVEGQNFVIEYGLAQNAAQLPHMAAELVRLKVDVLVASGTPSIVPARNATKTIPIVFVAAIDPVGAGMTASLARPGGNFTGVTAMTADLMAKRLGLLKELLPKLSRVAVLARPTSPATRQYVKEAELAAQALGLQLRVLSARDAGDLEGAFSALPFSVPQGASAVLVVDDAVFTSQRARIAELALKHRLPTSFGFSDMVEAGGLMAYGPHYGDMYRRAAVQVHKLLKGAQPAELPVEQPVRFELVINVKTAKALGLTIPPSLLQRADQIIE